MSSVPLEQVVEFQRTLARAADLRLAPDGKGGVRWVVGGTGPAGPAGPQGPAGADGATGPAGPAGADGADGADGVDGADGADGAPGPNLVDGTTATTLTGALVGDGANISGVAASTSGNVLTSNGTTWVSQAPAAATLAYFTESRNTSAPNATIPAHRWIPTGADTHIDIVLEPKGTSGSVLGQIPDNTTTGGNKRGVRAVDFQRTRATSAARVASGQESLIGNGNSNTASGQNAAVLNGTVCTASGQNSFVGNGSSCTASGLYSMVGNGDGNVVTGRGAVICGGVSNSNAADNGFIGTGGRASVNTGSTGYGNSLSAAADGSGIMCGQECSITSVSSAIGGGQSNEISALYGGILCGYANSVTGEGGAIGGGKINIASGVVSAVPGGLRGMASLYGQQANAAGMFAATGDAQRSVLVLRRSVTGTAASQLYLDGASAKADMGTGNRVWTVTATITGVCVTLGNGTGPLAVGQVGSYRRSWTQKRVTNDAGTALVGAVATPIADVADAGFAGAVITITADTSDGSAKIEVTAPTLAGSTTVIRWVCELHIHNEIGF